MFVLLRFVLLQGRCLLSGRTMEWWLSVQVHLSRCHNRTLPVWPQVSIQNKYACICAVYTRIRSQRYYLCFYNIDKFIKVPLIQINLLSKVMAINRSCSLCFFSVPLIELSIFFSRCLSWPSLPSVCSLQAPAPGLCCPQPKCPSNVQINFPPGYQIE